MPNGRGRTARYFDELFPELLIPTILGVGAAYSPHTARGVQTGLESAAVIDRIRQRGFQRRMQEMGKESFDAALEEHRRRMEANEDPGETGQLHPGGPSVPTAVAPREAPAAMDIFNQLGIYTGDAGFAQDQAALMGPGIGALPTREPQVTFEEVQSILDRQREPEPQIAIPRGIEPREQLMMDLASAGAYERPALMAHTYGQFNIQQQNAENQLIRQAQQARHWTRNAEVRGRIDKALKDLEYDRREGLAMLEHAMRLERGAPIPSHGGAWVPPGSEWEYVAGARGETPGAEEDWSRMGSKELAEHYAQMGAALDRVRGNPEEREQTRLIMKRILSYLVQHDDWEQQLEEARGRVAGSSLDAIIERLAAALQVEPDTLRTR